MSLRTLVGGVIGVVSGCFFFDLRLDLKKKYIFFIMYTLIIKEKAVEFETWEDLQDFLHKKWISDRIAKNGRRKKKVGAESANESDLIYRVKTNQSFCVRFDDEGII